MILIFYPKRPSNLIIRTYDFLLKNYFQCKKQNKETHIIVNPIYSLHCSGSNIGTFIVDDTFHKLYIIIIKTKLF